MSRCLGDLLAPLADGTLPPARTERALAHVALCPRCHHELAEERRVRAMLAGIDTPEVPPALLLSLTRIPDRPAAVSTAGIVPPPPLGGASAPAVVTPLRPSASPRRSGFAVGAVAVLATSAGLAMLAGAPQAATAVPAVVPDAAGFAAEHAATVGRASMTGPGLRPGAGAAAGGAAPVTVATGSSGSTGSALGSGPALAAFALPASLLPAAVASLPDRSAASPSRPAVVGAGLRTPDVDLAPTRAGQDAAPVGAVPVSAALTAPAAP